MAKNIIIVKKLLENKGQKNLNFLEKICKEYLDGKLLNILLSQPVVAPVVDFDLCAEIKDDNIDCLTISFIYCNLFCNIEINNEKTTFSAISFNQREIDEQGICEDKYFNNFDELTEFLKGLLKYLRSYKYFNGSYNEIDERKKFSDARKKGAKNIAIIMAVCGAVLLLLFFIFQAGGTTNTSTILPGIYFILSGGITYFAVDKLKGDYIIEKTGLFNFAGLILGIFIVLVIEDLNKGTLIKDRIFVYAVFVAFIITFVLMAIYYSRKKDKRKL